MKNLVKFEWHSIPFSSWIYKIASNEINTHFRKKRFWFLSLETLFEAPGFEVVEEVDLQEDYLQAQKQLERHEDFRQVRQLLKKLPSNYQEVLVLRFFEDKKSEARFLHFTSSQGLYVLMGIGQDNLPIFTLVGFGE